jgi:predicted peroxiredoxin
MKIAARVGLALALAAAVALAGGCSIGTRVYQYGAKDGVFVHITRGTDDPHRVLMGLKMAELMLEGGKDVLVYFDINGPAVVLKGAPDLTFSGFPSSKEQLDMLIKKGVTVCVCPGCLSAAGKKPEDLMEGVKIAKKEDFFNFTAGRILSLDY